MSEITEAQVAKWLKQPECFGMLSLLDNGNEVINLTDLPCHECVLKLKCVGREGQEAEARTR